MKHVILIDGGFLKQKYHKAFHRRIEAGNISNLSNILSTTHASGFDLLRIYYYDSPPLDFSIRTPISNTVEDLKGNPVYNHQSTLLDELKKTNYISVREGTLKFRGWKLKKSILDGFKRSGPCSQTVSDSWFEPNIQQKGVDTKIGLDMAWISFNGVADRVILVTGDSDFVPAIKAARRNGVQVILCTLDHGVAINLLNNVDVIDPTPINQLISISTS